MTRLRNLFLLVMFLGVALLGACVGAVAYVIWYALVALTKQDLMVP